MYYYPKKPFQKVDYQPRIMREKLQISLWRFDAYGIVKIKDRYFTPKHEKFSRDSWPGFEPMTFSLDKEEIILVQKKSSTDREPLVLIIDAFSLEVKHELVVPTIDEEFEGGDGYYDHYYDDSSSAYPTKGDMPKVLVWNHCKYLMVHYHSLSNQINKRFSGIKLVPAAQIPANFPFLLSKYWHIWS